MRPSAPTSPERDASYTCGCTAERRMDAAGLDGRDERAANATQAAKDKALSMRAVWRYMRVSGYPSRASGLSRLCCGSVMRGAGFRPVASDPQRQSGPIAETPTEERYIQEFEDLLSHLKLRGIGGACKSALRSATCWIDARPRNNVVSLDSMGRPGRSWSLRWRRARTRASARPELCAHRSGDPLCLDGQ